MAMTPSLRKKLLAAVGGGAIAIAATLIPTLEGVEYKPYQDVVGVWTVCYGHTGKDIMLGKTYTELECRALLDIAGTFGNRAIDQQAWLTSSGLWDQLQAEGVTPTADDLADQANGDVPRQLMIAARDHLTPAAYGYRMKYLVRPKLIELGLYKD